NIMILLLSLFVLFGGFLIVNQKVVKEGKLAVKYRIDEIIKNDVLKSFIIKRFGNVHVGTNMNIMRPIGTIVYLREVTCLIIMVVSIFKVCMQIKSLFLLRKCLLCCISRRLELACNFSLIY